MSTQQVESEFDADTRVLRDDEVDQVDGGLVVIAIIAVLIGLLVPAVQ
jgi:hypothetical protein